MRQLPVSATTRDHTARVLITAHDASSHLNDFRFESAHGAEHIRVQGIGQRVARVDLVDQLGDAAVVAVDLARQLAYRQYVSILRPYKRITRSVFNKSQLSRDLSSLRLIF